ncbi:flagellar biosynthetic protein FliR [Denitrobaculum tricleocarpae]|uniref:Flagellar biosynthetic protein FliR n=1 Tax=Denitrobaculum tricleocarpae TaxID=2591009 RepID=A0A545T213_9PROT|nr:flagellar biosynthetic protein FliR [Denitrobaculum tricleocarpae]TQV71251.1 flagellar type III secretion system protein FliR [Denitrobaculum tricleocarpae]
MLDELLSAELFVVIFVFVRVGATMMLLPGFAEPYVAPRTRLMLALLISIVIAPVVGDTVPPLPDAVLTLALLIIGELVIGFFLGTVTRLFLATMATAGMIIAFMSSLANALVDDPSSQQQGSIMGSFLTTVAVLMMFLLDLHHVMLMAVADSYTLFRPGEALPMGDLSEMITRVVAKTFLLAVQLAAPFIVVGTIFYLGLGVLGRLMPQVQIFFVAMPLQVAMGVIILFLSLPVMMGFYITQFSDTLMPFLAPS